MSYIVNIQVEPSTLTAVLNRYYAGILLLFAKVAKQEVGLLFNTYIQLV
jgi:hypothetical protein